MKPILFSLALGAVLFAGCRKDDEPQKPQQTGGKGGSVALRISVLHHTKPVDSGIVYIKYNSDKAPANGQWDDTAHIQKLGTAPAQAIFTGLKPGSYYLVGSGLEATNIPEYYQKLEGGLPYVIADTGTVKNVTLFVTEPGEPL